MHFSLKMAPNHHFVLNSLPLEPVSRTYQYRKIMKPMLERKRRARINKCLDELKDLMTGTLQADGENVAKLEKADILELTVRHLHRLRENNALFVRSSDTMDMDKFWAGFQHCAAEVSQFLHNYDRHVSGDLIKHIASYIPNMAAAVAVAAAAATTTSTPAVAAASANYQRFCTAMSQLPLVTQPLSGAATPPPRAKTPTVHMSTAADATAAAPTTSAKMRMHPYAVALEAVGSADGDGVWRPW